MRNSELAKRQISRSEIKWLLTRGTRERLGGEGSNTRWSCSGYLGRKEASVVFVEGRTQIDVLTVTWE